MDPKQITTMLTEVDKVPTFKVGDDFTLELDLGPPNAEIAKVAQKELRESPELQNTAVAELRELLKAETDLKCPLEHDAWLIRFLRPCKYYPESALKLIKNYYQFKDKYSGVYEDLKPSNENKIFAHNILTVLPNRDQFGRRVLIVELGKKWNHHEVTLDEVFKGCVLLLEAAVLEPTSQIAGAVVIFDMDGLSIKQTMQFTPAFAKRLVDLLQDAAPLRIKNMHIVNEPFIFSTVFALFKPFLREKLKKRIVFHGNDRKSLHKYLSLTCLPECYGGELRTPEVTSTHWFELLMMYEKEFEAVNSYGYKKESKN